MGYYRIILGQKNMYAAEARENNYVGVGFMPDTNLTQKLTDNWRDFNKEFIPLFLETYPDKTKIGAGLAGGFTWTVCKGIALGDRVLCPDGNGDYMVGEVISDYQYAKGQNLPHRRSVRWYDSIPRSSMSEPLRNSCGSVGTVADISKYADELSSLITTGSQPKIVAKDETIEDPTVFALERHLEEFLVHNWRYTELGKQYDIYEVDGEIVGEQFPTDTGPIDILAISKDRKRLLVVELKRGRIGDVVVGQIQRYMGYAQDELAENGQTVHGVIIALEDDLRVRRALSVAHNIDFMTYEIKFKLKSIL